MSFSSSLVGKAIFVGHSSQTRSQKCFSLRVIAGESRIGKLPVAIPDKVTVSVNDRTVQVKVRVADCFAVCRVLILMIAMQCV